MKIYGVGQSRSFRAVWAAEEANINYDFVKVIFGSKEKNGSLSPEYLAINPQGKIPTMTDGDFSLTESAAIVNYIGHQAKTNQLIPEDGSQTRAKYDEMCFFILAELEQPLWTKGKHSFALPEAHRIPEIIDKTTHFEFEKAQKTLLLLKGDNEFAIGNAFTLADVLLAQTITWAIQFEYKVDEKLVEYKNKMEQRPAFKRALAVVANA